MKQIRRSRRDSVHLLVDSAATPIGNGRLGVTLISLVGSGTRADPYESFATSGWQQPQSVQPTLHPRSDSGRETMPLLRCMRATASSARRSWLCGIRRPAKGKRKPIFTIRIRANAAIQSSGSYSSLDSPRKVTRTGRMARFMTRRAAIAIPV
jgi:hypothetical protein